MPGPQYLTIEKTARYFLSGPLDAEYKSLCFALHGYGQLGPYFIRPFAGKDLSQVLFVAPEAPHRFYLQGSSGRVGASWMTKEDRLCDIADYCAYLDRLYQELMPVIQKVEQVGILGFSQGVATACRWLTSSAQHFDYLVNYAGVFPPDLDHSNAIPKMKKIPVRFLVGTEDEYFAGGKYEKHLEDFRQKGYPVELGFFEGRHKVYPQVLQELFDDMGLL